ncbi:hypothetical protein [Cellulomonas sp. Root137]|uniref:hypothetical protein n=1 Tax=Cellulomonas sp. Root137 TaxID=1736459 RepID=UPI0006F9BEE6|nr:hypothetical protein [Cellulomonas sp. Root137]KQY47771.1 hypothetical protein ASD18_10925 [Cellulomonas sp. Root137]
MDSLLVPSDVESALAHAGFRAVEVTAAGCVAAALDDADRLIELHVVPGIVDARLSERAARLREVRHEHLPQVLEVLDLSPGRVGLVVEHVPGLSLAQIRAARAPLTDGEAATVTIPLARAIEALRAAGLAHGSVSESTVVVRPDGRPVLTDLRGALAGADDTEADLRRLVTAVLAQMPGADVDLVTGVAGELTVREVLTDLLTVPGFSAEQVVDGCYRATEPTPVRLPDAGQLASSALSTGAREGDQVRRQTGTRRDERARRRRRSVRLAASVVAAALVLGGGVVGWRVLGAEAPAATAAPQEADDPVVAAIALSRLRAEVLGAGDPAALGAVEVVDGPAYRADSLLLPDLDGVRLDGFAVDVQDAWLVADDSRRGTTDVAVTAATSAYDRVPADGGAATQVAASAARTVVLGLRWTPDGWRVWDVRRP